MRELTVEETKKIELDILIKVAEFCEKHGLKYFLAYGTLIGAVRHKGFIPWDDDIDIHIPREDYNKLIESFNKDKDDAHLLLISPYDDFAQHTYVKIVDTRTVKKEKNKEYTKGLLGIDIDVFPLDGEPEDEKTFVRFYKKLQRIYKLHYYVTFNEKEHDISWKTKLFLKFLKKVIRDKNKLIDKASKIHAKYPYAESKYVGVVESVFNFKKNRFLKEFFEESILLEFEGYMFESPKYYDEILTLFYGDYMKLPPKDKQVTHHVHKTYIKTEIE